MTIYPIHTELPQYLLLKFLFLLRSIGKHVIKLLLNLRKFTRSVYQPKFLQKNLRTVLSLLSALKIHWQMKYLCIQ